MYLPAKFKEERPEVLRALMRTHPLATLIVPGMSGLIANHLPLETLSSPEPFGMLRGHIARANPLWKEYRADAEVLAIFQGPQSYISPNWYPSKQQSGEVVPTWNYAVVHARGTLRFSQDADWLRDLVSRLTATHEAAQPLPWKVGDAPEEFTRAMLAGIVGFEMTVSSLVGKMKLSQNRTEGDRDAVHQALQASADAEAREMAKMFSM